jgi:tetratricopeptide (TPR) repeat protein
LAAYRRAIACDQKYVNPHINLGALLDLEDDLDGAEKEYLIALDLGYKGAIVPANLSSVHYQRKNYREALRWANDAIRADAGYANAYKMLGQAHLALGNRDEALAAFKTAAKLDARWWRLPAKVPPLPTAPQPREKPDR